MDFSAIAFAKKWLHEVIFEAETPAGRIFDVLLIVSILLSVGVVMADSVVALRAAHGIFLDKMELFFTALFTVEYVLRLFCVRRPVAYAVSFYGVVDLVSVLPTWFALFFPATQFLAILRILRVLRIFRVLKLAQYVFEAYALVGALRASRRKITVFFFFVLTLVVIFGSLIYVIEGDSDGFTSIPRSIYWAVVTLTTVGYGDISPKTGAGQALASLVMVLGYSIIAVPTGIVTAEMTRHRDAVSTQACPGCGREGHDDDAVHCKYCGEIL